MMREAGDNNLWKLSIDKEMNKDDLRNKAKK